MQGSKLLVAGLAMAALGLGAAMPAAAAGSVKVDGTRFTLEVRSAGTPDTRMWMRSCS